MANLDLKKTLKHLYNPSAKIVSVVDIEPMNYLMIDGKGSPSTSQEYADAVPALYGIAYGIRAISKAAGTTFTVSPLEGLWSYAGQDNPSFNLTEADKETFVWTLMILQPEHITAVIFENARSAALKKKGNEAMHNVRFESYHEGEAVQIMHIGSYDDEGPTVKRLHDYINENGWHLSGTHHEIYLSDPRKVPPEKLKTVIRQPFSRS